MSRRLVLVLVATIALLLALAGTASAARHTGVVSATAPSVAAPALGVTVPALGPDCKGEPPLPSNPNGHLAVRPAIISSANPFTTPGVSIQSVYGTNYAWWNYDNGCSPQDGIMPSVGANLGNLLGLELPGLLPSWGQGLFSLVVDPASWIGALDETVATATASTAAGTWFPWLSLAMTVVAIVTLMRARRGQLSGSINAVAWAMLVLVVTSWAVRYPLESVKLLDDGVQTAVIGIADGFDRGGVAGPVAVTSDADKATAAQRTLDRQWDTLTRQTVFRSWAEGVFGDADSATARTYGPTVFAASHFSWVEYDAYVKDPAGAGAKIVAAKAQAFRQVADQIAQDDPLAYGYFTGNNWGDTIATALLSFVSVLMVALFLVVAGVFVVGAYVLIRLLLPFAPVAGVVFLVDATRDTALALFKKVIKPLVMGPIFFLAALVVLRYNVGILSSDLPAWLQLVLVFLVAFIVWTMLKPTAVLPRMRIPGSGAVSTFVGTRLGTEAGQKAADENDVSSNGRVNGIPTTGGERAHPVHHPAALPPARPPLFLPASPPPEDGGYIPVTVHRPGPAAGVEAGPLTGPALGARTSPVLSPSVAGIGAGSEAALRASRGTGRGTFVPLDHHVERPSTALGERTLREISGSPASAPAGQPTRAYAAGPAEQVALPAAVHAVPAGSPALWSTQHHVGTTAPRFSLAGNANEGGPSDGGDRAVTMIDDSNLTYDSSGKRVFVVFTPSGTRAVEGVRVES